MHAKQILGYGFIVYGAYTLIKLDEPVVLSDSYTAQQCCDNSTMAARGLLAVLLIYVGYKWTGMKL